MTRYRRIDLDGALVVITGAARGIGLATAKEFVAARAMVALGDLDEALAREAATGLGEGASGHRLDVSDKQSYADFLAAAEQTHGRAVDVLVNNAGVMPNGSTSASFRRSTPRTSRPPWCGRSAPGRPRSPSRPTSVSPPTAPRSSPSG